MRAKMPTNHALRKYGLRAADTDLTKAIPLNFALLEKPWQPWTLPERISRLFLDYYVRRKDVGGSEEDFSQNHGLPPWTILNELLARGGIALRATEPEALTADYSVKMRSLHDGSVLDIGELSNGEQRIVMNTLWRYVSAIPDSNFPKVLLLDEPDAHLHTALIPPFLRDMKSLIDDFGCQIVWSTQRPDTIALVPEESLFEVTASDPRIRRATSRASCLCAVADNLLSVGPLTRVVFVEDQDDVDFYKTVASALVSAELLEATPNFETSSVGRGKPKVSGGASNVRTWVRKFNASGLAGIVQGIVDRDAGSPSELNVHVLERYAIENYLVDPLIVFCAMLDEGIAPAVPGLTLSAGDEYRVTRASSATKQALADAVVSLIETTLVPTECERERVSVEMSDGGSLWYPRWLIERKGHDLFSKIFQALGRKIDRARLLKAIGRVRLVPADLLRLNKDILAAQRIAEATVSQEPPLIRAPSS
jgi:hypothetical protein